MPTIEELFDLTGRVAIVTGGSRGLGEEMAEGLAEAGASLMLCARRQEWLTPTVDRLRGRGFSVEGVVCDVSKPSDVQIVVDRALAAYKQIDILVNNAGVTWGERPEAMPLDKWQKVIDVNLTGAFLFSQAVGRHMLTRKYGRIINVASIAGLRGSVAGRPSPDTPRARRASWGSRASWRLPGAATGSASTRSRPVTFTPAWPTP